MARSAVSDPLEKFRFQVTWTATPEGVDDQGEKVPAVLVRAGFHDFQMPKRSTNKIDYRDGIDPDINQKSPGLSSMEDVVLSRGLLADPDVALSNEFYDWMRLVHSPTAGHKTRAALDGRGVAASNDYRKDVTVQQLDREGAIVKQWTMFQAWPVNFVPGGDLNASEDGEKSLEQLTLTYEDFKEEVPASTNPRPPAS